MYHNSNVLNKIRFIERTSTTTPYGGPDAETIDQCYNDLLAMVNSDPCQPLTYTGRCAGLQEKIESNLFRFEPIAAKKAECVSDDPNTFACFQFYLSKAENCEMDSMSFEDGPCAGQAEALFEWGEKADNKKLYAKIDEAISKCTDRNPSVPAKETARTY